MLESAISAQAMQLADRVQSNLLGKDEGTGENGGGGGNENPRRYQNTRPKRVMMLMGWMILIAGIIYGLQIFTQFLLQLAENEKFMAQLASSLKLCSSSATSCQNNATVRELAGSPSLETSGEGEGQ